MLQIHSSFNYFSYTNKLAVRAGAFAKRAALMHIKNNNILFTKRTCPQTKHPIRTADVKHLGNFETTTSAARERFFMYPSIVWLDVFVER